MDVLHDLSPAATRAANQENFLAFCRTLAAADPDFHLHDDGELLYANHDTVAHPLLNSVMRTRLAPEHLDETITHTVRHYQGLKRPWLWFVWSGDRPDSLAEGLAAHGFTSIDGQGAPLMSLDLTRLPPRPDLPAGFTITRVSDREALTVCSQVAARVFEMDFAAADRFGRVNEHVGFGEEAPLQFYVGWLGGEPVGTSMVFYGAGVAGVYRISTLPEHRGKGIGTAMTLWPHYAALARGYRVATLQASEMGAPIYERMGYRVDGTRQIFLHPGPAST